MSQSAAKESMMFAYCESCGTVYASGKTGYCTRKRCSHQRLTDMALPTVNVLSTCLARTFCRLMRVYLSPEEIELTNERNKTEAAGYCHSHDFCDSNVVMTQALAEHGLEVNMQDEKQVALINAAWDTAQLYEFAL